MLFQVFPVSSLFQNTHAPSESKFSRPLSASFPSLFSLCIRHKERPHVRNGLNLAWRHHKSRRHYSSDQNTEARVVNKFFDDFSDRKKRKEISLMETEATFGNWVGKVSFCWVDVFTRKKL